MTEGGIASWKKKEGETFTAGDVLLEIETDKATIDVEAQDDGIMGRILEMDGTKNVPVGKVIALLAEEGDDITNLEIPQDVRPTPAASHSTPTPPPPQRSVQEQPKIEHSHSKTPSHSRPLFPSVHRLLVEYNIQKLDAIKGTGVRGMLTKGDILAYLGKASSPTGTFKPEKKLQHGTSQKPLKEEPKPLDGSALRKLIVSSMLQSSLKARNPPSPTKVDFDSIVADYLPNQSLKAVAASARGPQSKTTTATDYFAGLL
ncbi:hypothetical protein AMATHDRAFT_57098 [Amanita thiersii Skay4041]|uniref:Single hybrid motif-containing protein n=1 Tax=Amanita thiersii Skay4041 TaxID=703135 RepID=A0A2A9NT01_9AGAR|nr:hypothetical protein AMATHDRAFT_57098 [Amanita thiersii Skay4041]